MLIMFLFFTTTTKLKIDNENESISETVIGDDEIEVVKVVPSLIIGKNHARVRCSLGKGIQIINVQYLIIHLDLWQILSMLIL